MEGCKIKKFDYPFINHEEATKFCHLKDMKCVAKLSPRLDMRNLKAQQKALKVLEVHMKNSLGPGWFQELSMNQIAAANMLFTAVGMDGVYCQLKRVIPVLNQINIQPLPITQKLVAALKFARGSDLAFLWFLYDRVYRSSSDVCTQKSYTLNERLILSCICHLDMLLTLRELERILPKVEKRKRKIKLEKPRVKCEKKVYETPYDEPLPRSKFPEREVIKKPQRPQPKFEIYEMYKDPYYIIENEVNRWFASSSLMPTEGECIVQKIFEDQVKEVGENQGKNSKNLCKKHARESSHFYKMMDKIRNNNEDNDDQRALPHLNEFENKVAKDVKKELVNSKKEELDREEKNQKPIIIQTILLDIITSAVDQRFLSLCDKCEDCLKSRNIEQEKLKSSSSTSSIIDYCHRPSSYGPLTFDYGKIFATSFLENHGAVQNSINTALELERHLTEDNAITVCLRDMWQLEMQLWNERRQADVVDRQEQVAGELDGLWGNRKKILKLLKDGIKILRRNQKFVLAALPDSHRLPILKEWILQKYGVKLTDEEERKRFKINKDQREILISRGLVPRVEVPTYEEFGIKKPSISIDEVIKMKKKRDKWVKKYERKLASGCVDRCRIYYATMEPYYCNFEAMRSMYYAYLPGVYKQLDQQIMNKDIL